MSTSPALAGGTLGSDSAPGSTSPRTTSGRADPSGTAPPGSNPRGTNPQGTNRPGTNRPGTNPPDTTAVARAKRPRVKARNVLVFLMLAGPNIALLLVFTYRPRILRSYYSIQR